MQATKYVAEGHGAPGFPIETSVSYRSLGVRNLSKVGNGRTIDISSKMITFAPERELPNGIGLRMGGQVAVQNSWFDRDGPDTIRRRELLRLIRNHNED